MTKARQATKVLKVWKARLVLEAPSASVAIKAPPVNPDPKVSKAFQVIRVHVVNEVTKGQRESKGRKV